MSKLMLNLRKSPAADSIAGVISKPHDRPLRAPRQPKGASEEARSCLTYCIHDQRAI
jgi:hypothetical protein